MKNYTFKLKQKGFTLIEALVVVVIVGIVASFALPVFDNIVKSQRMNGISNEIITTIQTARSEAIKRSAMVRVCFKISESGSGCQNPVGGATRSNYIYAFVDANNNRARNPGEEIVYQSNLFNEETTYRNSSINNRRWNRSITFNAQGRAGFDNTTANANRNQRAAILGLCDSRKDNSVGVVIKIGVTGRAQLGSIKPTDGIAC